MNLSGRVLSEADAYRVKLDKIQTLLTRTQKYVVPTISDEDFGYRDGLVDMIEQVQEILDL